MHLVVVQNQPCARPAGQQCMTGLLIGEHTKKLGFSDAPCMSPQLSPSKRAGYNTIGLGLFSNIQACYASKVYCTYHVS